MSNQADYVLYWGSGSPFASRVMIYLYEKDIAFESHLIQFSKKEHKTEEFLKMNPRGKIPLLVDRSITPNVYVYESLAILQYLQAKHDPLYDVNDRHTLATTLVRATEAENYLFPACQGVVSICWHSKPEDWNLGALKKNLASLEEELKKWEAYLSANKDNTYLNGTSNFTLADNIATGMLLLLDRFSYPLKEKGLNRLSHYVELVKKRDSVQKSCPPHWRTSECSVTYSTLMQRLSQ